MLMHLGDGGVVELVAATAAAAAATPLVVIADKTFELMWVCFGFF